MHACLIRAANKTFVGFEDMHGELVQLAMLRRLNEVCLRVGVPGWDSDAICTNLMRAKMGDVLQHTSQVKNDICNISRSYDNGELKGSLQKHIYKILTPNPKCQWHDVLKHKVNLLLSEEYQLEHFNQSQLRVFHKQFKSMHSQVRTSVFKTLISSWSTSARMHEKRVLPCIFGCDVGRDDLQHYLCCPALWAIVCASSPSPPPRVLWDLSPRERLCLLAPTPLGLKMLAVASRGYHTIKLGHREKIELAITTKEFSAIHSCLFESVRDFWVQIGPLCPMCHS